MKPICKWLLISACLGLVTTYPGLLYSDSAEVLPQGVSRIQVKYSYYQPVENLFNEDGIKEGVDSPFNMTLYADLIGGSASSVIGDSVVDFEYVYRDLIIDYYYGLTDNLTIGVKIPYYWNETKINELTVDNSGADSPYDMYPPETLTAGLLAALEAPPFEYKPLETWSASGLSDIELRARYKYHDDGDFRLAFTGGLRLATGDTDDPDNLIDTDFGSGANAVLIQFNNDYIGVENLTLNLTVSYDLVLPEKEEVRVPAFPGQAMMYSAQKENVDKDLGDILRTSIAGDYSFSKTFSAGLKYEYASKQKDKVDGDLGLLYSELEEGTDWTSQTLIVNITYSTVQTYLDEKTGIPMDVFFEYESVFDGKNGVLEQEILSIGCSLYF